MKKTKKQSNRTFPSIGRVSNNNITKILIPKSSSVNLPMAVEGGSKRPEEKKI